MTSPACSGRRQWHRESSQPLPAYLPPPPPDRGNQGRGGLLSARLQGAAIERRPVTTTLRNSPNLSFTHGCVARQPVPLPTCTGYKTPWSGAGAPHAPPADLARRRHGPRLDPPTLSPQDAPPGEDGRVKASMGPHTRGQAALLAPPVNDAARGCAPPPPPRACRSSTCRNVKDTRAPPPRR